MATNPLNFMAEPVTLTHYDPSYQSISGYKREAEYNSVTTHDGGSPSKRSHYGKCQYKTGKCFNERTVKRNGEAHSLCEEHRVKQNLIQRRSDRKYQTVHAVRRRERSQRRAVLKKQVSMAVAQQLFYEHQQQKTMGIPLPEHHPLHFLTTDVDDAASMNLSASKNVNLAPPIQVPPPGFMFGSQSDLESSLILSVLPQSNCLEIANSKIEIALASDESSPTGIDDFSLNMFLTTSMCSGGYKLPTLTEDEIGVTCVLSENLGFQPILSCTDDKEMWSDDDIKFLQTILLA